jgi:hypothetical protein
LQRLKLHIVSFDIPDPPDYGGVIDVFYKVKNLSEAGVEIYLHCPEYGSRTRSKMLDQLCKKVWYYPRAIGIAGISLSVPYTVYSRRSDRLLQNLLDIKAPILFDGVSASFYISHPLLSGRLKILRNQNVEQNYYRLLGQRETNPLKRIYYLAEAMLLKRYEDRLDEADAFFTVALHDYQFFLKKYPEAHHEYVPSFQPYNNVNSQPGKGDYAIYHGNLGLAENREAAVYLLKEIIPFVQFPFVITGRNPDSEILKLARGLGNCRVISNPGMDEMNELINNAQVQVLTTFQNTGLKLKLLHALFNGRHVLVNEAMVHGTGLAEICTVASSANEMINRLNQLKDIPFTTDEITKRAGVLLEHYDNKRNAERIITFLRQRSL